MARDFFLGFVKIHILHHAAHAPVYGMATIANILVSFAGLPHVLGFDDHVLPFLYA
jgi:hypothetical protein